MTSAMDIEAEAIAAVGEAVTLTDAELIRATAKERVRAAEAKLANLPPPTVMNSALGLWAFGIAEKELREAKADLAALDEEKPARLKLYVSGPMSGYPGANYPLFNAVTALLRRAGHVVYNPAEFPHDGPKETFPLRKAFAEYAKFICEEADAIVLLPAWEASLGVSAELALAKNCKLAVYSFDNIETLLDATSVV